MTLAFADNPPAYFPEDVLVAGDRGETRWGAVRTRPRHEKAFAWELKERDIAYCLPMVPHPQPSTQRARSSLLPLFSGYVFARADDAQWRRAWDTRRIVRVHPVADGGRLCRELQSIAVAIRCRRVELCPVPALGTRVVVSRGPLAGIEGILLRRRNRHRLVLQVEGINLAVRVDVDASELAR